MEQPIDILKIKSSFTQEVSRKYELGDEVVIVLKGSIVKHEIGDNQDGSVNLTMKFKPLIVEISEN